MNPLPKGWATARLGEIVDVVRGASPRPKGDPRYFGGPIPWISIGDLSREKDRTLSKTVEGVTPAGAEKSRLLSAGTLILSNSATVGIPKILAMDGCIHDGFVAFPNLDQRLLTAEFLYEFFRHIRTRLIDENRRGVTQVNLNTEIVRNIDVLVPPLAEQRRIVAKLDALFSRSRAARASLERLSALIQRLRQAILAAAFRGDLSSTIRVEGSRRQGVVHVSPEARSTRAQRSPKSPHSQSDPRNQLPTGWSYLPLNQIAEIQVGYAFKSNEFISHGVRLLRGVNVTPRATRWDEVVYISEVLASTYARYELNVGDIVLAMDRPLIASGLKVSQITKDDCPALLVQRVARITGREGVSTDFLFSFLQSAGFIEHLRDHATGTQLPHVSASDIGSVLVPVPPLDEQQEIVRQLARAEKVVDRLRRSIECTQEQASLFEHTALAAAFRGELVPQDPNDEPASALLERIRAEREAPLPVKGKRGASTSSPAKPRTSKAAP